MDPSASHPRTTGPGSPARLRPPLWAQFAISLLIAAVLIVLLVRFVDANSTPRAQAPHVSAKGSKVLNQEAEILDAQLQAPQVVHFAPAVAPQTAIEHAIANYMTQQIDFNQIPGPLQQTLCFAVPDSVDGHLAFRCSALARATSYPFEGVVDHAAGTVTYCRHNPPPNPGDSVPLSRRCIA